MIKKKKVTAFTIVAIIIVAIAIAIVYQRSLETFGTEEAGYMTIDEVVLQQKTCGDMQKKLGNDSLYPIYYTAAVKKQKTKKLSMERACENTEAELLRYEAIQWYAENHGMAVTEADVKKRIDTLIDEMKTTEEYQQYQEAAKKLGTTYENIIRSDYKTYYYAEVLNKVYTHEYDKFVQSDQLTQEELKQQQQAFQKRWDNFISNVIREFKNSKVYDDTNTELTLCKTLVTNNVTKISQITKAGL